jgi:hypothetical protein
MCVWLMPYKHFCPGISRQNCLIKCVAELRRLSESLIRIHYQLLSLTDSNYIPIKTMAHHLARSALAQITEQRVLEAAVNLPEDEENEAGPPDDAKQFELPQQLIEKLMATLRADSTLEVR